MKKLLLFSTLLLFVASCNQSKIDSLNNHIQLLQKDSIEYTAKNKVLQAKADSMKSQLKVLDSIKFAEKMCNYGSVLLNLNESIKSYFKRKVSYSQALEQCTIAKNEFIKIESSIKPKLKEDVEKSLSEYQKGLSMIQERLGGINGFTNNDGYYQVNDTYSRNNYMACQLWIEFYKVRNEHIKKDLCKTEK